MDLASAQLGAASMSESFLRNYRGGSPPSFLEVNDGLAIRVNQNGSFNFDELNAWPRLARLRIARLDFGIAPPDRYGINRGF